MKRLLPLALLLTGCAENALLELTLLMPDEGVAGAPRAVLDFAEDRATEPDDVRFLESLRASLRLPPDGDPEQYVTVVAGDDPTAPLWISVRYCNDPGCQGAGDDLATRQLVRYERPFWPGRRSRATLTLPAPGADVERLDLCQVIACAGDGNPVTGCCEPTDPRCPREGGPTHLCERD